MMTPPTNKLVGLAAFAATLLAGVGLGRVTAPTTDSASAATTTTTTSATPPQTDADASDAMDARRPGPPAAARAGSRPTRPGVEGAEDAEGALVVPVDGQDDERAAGPGTAHTLAACEAGLAQQREQLSVIERRRKELEGEPIAARSDAPPRFQATAMVQTFERAFAATRLVGKVESVDCTEYPCILFGRLQGDEEGVATLEDSEAFAAYDDDLGVMLTWASADLDHGGGTKPGLQREKPPEVSLFAFAYYTREDREQHGEMIDRRIRVRTAEYWNSSTVRE